LAGWAFSLLSFAARTDVVIPGRGEHRFPGYDVTAEARAWDPVTRELVLSRLDGPPSLQFFSPAEARTAGALLDRLLAQNEEPRVPVLSAIDSRLADSAGDGYRHEDLPEDPEAWRQSLAALDEEAAAIGAASFAELPIARQLHLLEQVRTTAGQWRGMSASHTFGLWMRYACAAFYAHPWAWNEIGFGGPAYPRGYKNLGFDRREPWEVAERHARDPIPWVEQAEAARSRHKDAMSGES
jgi:hypothetical protein